MSSKLDFRALIQPVPSLPEAAQTEILARYKPTETYVCSEPEDFEAFLRQIRPPRVAVVAYAALLGEQRGRKWDRADNMAGMKAAIHKRGSYVVEASSGRRSDKNWPGMRRDGEAMCGRISQGSKSVINARRGAEPYDFSDKHLGIILRVMESRRYSNDDERIEAIRRQGVRPVPKRTWLWTKLDKLARERGLKD